MGGGHKNAFVLGVVVHSIFIPFRFIKSLSYIKRYEFYDSYQPPPHFSLVLLKEIQIFRVLVWDW